jgi:hypothetical protein
MLLSYTVIVLIVWRKNEYIGKTRKQTLGMRSEGKGKGNPQYPPLVAVGREARSIPSLIALGTVKK